MCRTRGDRGLHVGVKSSDRNGAGLRCREGINDFSHDGVVVDVLDTRNLFQHLLIFVVDTVVQSRVFEDTLRSRASFVRREGWRSCDLFPRERRASDNAVLTLLSLFTSRRTGCRGVRVVLRCTSVVMVVSCHCDGGKKCVVSTNCE
jgi:hypothetical protein